MKYFPIWTIGAKWRNKYPSYGSISHCLNVSSVFSSDWNSFTFSGVVYLWLIIMSYKQLCWVWLTACWLSMMGKGDVLVTASVLQLSRSLLKDIYKEHPISLSLSLFPLTSLSLEMLYWVNCIIPHIPPSLSFHSHFCSLFPIQTLANPHVSKSHAIPQGRVRVLIYLEGMLILEKERRSLHSQRRARYEGGKFDLTGGLSQRHTCVLTAGVTGWLNNTKTS